VKGYREQILAMIAEVGDLCQELTGNVDVIFTGDTWHSKRPDRTSHYLVQQVQDVFRNHYHPIFPLLLPGNHDMSSDGEGSLPRQPLGDLRSDAILLRGGEPISLRDLVVIPRPYNRQRDADPTYYALTEDEKYWLRETKTPATHILLVAHGSILPPGQSRPFPYITADQIDTTGIDVIACGHLHEDLGIHRLKDGTLFLNLGSIARTSRTQDNLTRPVKVAVITFSDVISVEEVPLKSVLPASEVFYETVMGGTDPDTADEIVEFAESLARGLDVETITIDELLADMPDFPDVDREEVGALVKHYLEEEA